MNKLVSVTAALLLTIFSTTLIAAEEADENQLSALTTDEIATSCEKQYNAEVYPADEERMTLVDQCINEKSEMVQQSSDN